MYFLLTLHLLTEYRKSESLSDVLDLLRKVNDNVQEILRGRYGPQQESPRQAVEDLAKRNPDMELNMNENSWLSTSQDLFSTHIDLELAVPYNHSTAAHQLLKWPVLRRMVSDKKSSPGAIFFETGLDWFLALHQSPRSLDFRLKNHISSEGGTPHTTLMDIPYADVVKCAETYFETFNYVYPLLDRPTFFQETLPMAIRKESLSPYYNGEESSALTLLVIALGQLALVETIGDRVVPGEESNSQTTFPAAIACFNEARRRLVFIESDYTLEIVQIQALISFVILKATINVALSANNQ